MEEKQFLELIDEHQGIIHKMCRLYRDTEADREDLFQEIVFQLWRSIGSFRGGAKISSFIYRIAINTAIVSFRGGKAKLIEYRETLPESADDEQDANLAQRREQLMTAIRILGETDRAIMAMLLDEFSYREIGEVMGLSENTVAVRISRIKDKIRTILIQKKWN